MKKRLLAVFLALALCVGLTVPAFAAGTKKVVENTTQGLKITMDGFLRLETHRYNNNLYIDETGAVFDGWTDTYKIYVVADNSTVTVEALPGRKYADPSFLEALKDWLKKPGGGINSTEPGYEEYEAFSNNRESYAYELPYWEDWHLDHEGFFYDFGGVARPLEKATTLTATPSENEDFIVLYEGYGVYWMCESDFNKLVPATLQASSWAKAEVEKAYDAEIMPFSPYVADCTKGMTRAQFAAVTVYLYSAMMGNPGYYPEVDEDHPFTDVDYDATDLETEIGMAYNLGFIKGSNSAGTLFNPKGTLTRQEAAVMLGRVFTKLGGTIPTVSSTAFADDGNVAGWAKSEVAFMSGKDIVKGVGGNQFAPSKALSIQEAVIMANRMLETLK